MGSKTLRLFPKTAKIRKMGNETSFSFPKTPKITKVGNETALSFPKMPKIAELDDRKAPLSGQIYSSTLSIIIFGQTKPSNPRGCNQSDCVLKWL